MSSARSRTRLAVGLAALGSTIATVAVTGPVEAAPVTERTVAWTTVDHRTAFTVAPARLGHQLHFAGHPLDVAFDSTGAAWTLGEFGMQVGRSTEASTTMAKLNVPLRTYVANGTLLGWTEPFQSSFADYSSTSELGESVVSTPTSVWVALGGQQRQDGQYNHSLLVRYSTTAPYSACVVPLPGDDNQVIGLAHDTKRNRIWFAESNGDNRTAGAYSTIGWVKEAGLGNRCQNTLDFGGDPRLTAAQDAAVRAAAATTVNGLACTAVQEPNATADCVHHGSSAIPPGATHLAYDAALDTLWFTNWADRKLRRYSPATNTLVATHDAPDSPLPAFGAVAWQIATDSRAVYFNEYQGNRVLRFDKAAKTWTSVRTTTDEALETHSITVSGKWLWFTLSDEDYDSRARIGRIDLDTWAAGGAVRGTVYDRWETLAMSPGAPAANRHSFRGIDVRNGKVAVTDHGDMQTLVLTPR